MKKLVIFTYPSNVFWFSVVFPLFSISTRYFASFLSHGIATEIIPSIPHLYQEKYNRSLSLFFSICGFISTFFVIISIRTFINKIPKEKQKSSFNLYTTLIIIFGIVMNFSLLLFNFLDINQMPFFTSLNLSLFYISASVFHISIGKIPGRFTYIDDFAKIFNYILLIASIIAIFSFNICCLTHKINSLYYISSISQYIGFITCFLKFIIVGTVFNGDRFLSLFVEKKETNRNQGMNRVDTNLILP